MSPSAETKLKGVKRSLCNEKNIVKLGAKAFDITQKDFMMKAFINLFILYLI